MPAAIAVNIERYRTRLFPIAVFFLLYVVLDELVIHTPLMRMYPGAIWPATGVALAALMLYGVELWPAIVVGSLVVMFFQGYPFVVGLGVAAGNTAQAILGTYILKRFDFDSKLARLRDPFVVIVVSLTVSLIAPSIILATLWAENMLGTNPEVAWASWWTSQILSMMVTTSFLVRWSRQLYQRTSAQWVETIVVVGTLVAIDLLLFWTPYANAAGLPVIYLILIPLIWIALRLGPRWMTFALFVTSVIALLGVASGNYDHSMPLIDELLDIKIFIIVLSIIFLLFVSSEESRKETAKSLQEHVGQLEYALQKISAEDKAKNEFIAVLAHELRNPLAPILSSLEIIKLQGTAADIPGLVENMYDHIRTMARLLDDLLDISRISQKKFKLQKESVDFRSVAVRSIQSVEPLIQGRKHTLTVSMPEEPVWLQADPVRLEQVVSNLLNNAAKYTNPSGTIELRVSREAGDLVVRVRDNGIGIESHMLTRIFEPFLQVERGKQSAGLGIGLSLTKRLVEMHHGSIEAHSAGLGKGSEFVVRLPLPTSIQLPMPIVRAQRAARRAARFATRMPPAPGEVEARRILVVDDNEAAAQGLAKLLSYRGHEVSVAYSGEAGLEAAARSNPQIVILDIGLPGIDGYEVARRLRTSNNKDAVFIALTGYGQAEDKKKAAEAGFSFHLTKPVGLAEVEAVLAKV